MTTMNSINVNDISRRLFGSTAANFRFGFTLTELKCVTQILVDEL